MATLQTLQILIFLIPGFISAAILNALIVRKDKKEFAHIIEALMFTMIIYTIYSLIGMRIPVIPGKDESIEIEGISFLLLLALSIIIPVFFAYALHNDLIMRIARKIRITKKTSRDSVWNDVFITHSSTITVDFANGRRLMGYPRFYSDSDERTFLYLQKPQWLVEDKETKKINKVDMDVEGILITAEQKIDMITFHNPIDN